MTNPNTTQLSPDEWKALCITNVAQLHTYLQGIPPMIEGGADGITDAHLALIESHMNRGRAFLNAWQRSRAEGSIAPQQPVQAAQPQPDAQQGASEANGADTSKKRGGWPKGKKRNAPRQDAVTQ